MNKYKLTAAIIGAVTTLFLVGCGGGGSSGGGTTPTGASVLSVTGLNDNPTAAFDIVVTFSEAVSGLTSTGITTENLNIISVTPTGGEPATVWTVNAESSTDLLDGSMVTMSLIISAGVASNVNEIGNAASTRFTATFTAPSGARVMSVTGLNDSPSTRAFDIVVTFSEDVSGLTTDGITTENLNIISVEPTPTESATEWTVRVQPTTDLSNGETVPMSLMIKSGVARNANLIGNAASGDFMATFTAPDTTGASIEIANFNMTTTVAAFDVVVTFSDAFSDLLTTHFTPTNLTVNNVTPIGTLPAFMWNVNVTPINVDRSDGATTNFSLSIAEETIADSDGKMNANLASMGGSGTYIEPHIPPTVMIEGVPESHNGRSAGAFTLTATFDEDVTGFEAADVSVTNASVVVSPMSNRVYTLMVRPDGVENIMLSIPEDSAEDAAMNGNEASDMVTVMYVEPDPNLVTNPLPRVGGEPDAVSYILTTESDEVILSHNGDGSAIRVHITFNQVVGSLGTDITSPNATIDAIAAGGIFTRGQVGNAIIPNANLAEAIIIRYGVGLILANIGGLSGTFIASQAFTITIPYIP